MIKTLEFQFGESVPSWVKICRLQFVTKVDGEWQIYDIGTLDKAQSNYYKATFDNIVVNSSWKWSTGGALSDPFLFTGKAVECNPSKPKNAVISVTFNEPLLVMRGFYYCFTGDSPQHLRVYDENDNLIYENNNLELETLTSASTTEILESNYFKEIPELQVVKAYPVNVLGTLETNNISHVSNIYSVDQIFPHQVEPDGTMIRYALSFDNRATYQSYKNGSWNIIDKANIINEGMTQAELSGLTTSEYVLALTDKKTIDIFIGMMTTNTTTTPSVSKITTDYLEIV